MPSDLTGVSVYEAAEQGFRFHPGPVFAQVLLADEINRASPKTQSALLEAMEEKQVSIEGRSHPLPTPFFVIATQNPLEQLGTYPLPESQLDRFLMRISLGYPNREAELQLLQNHGHRQLADALPAHIDSTDLGTAASGRPASACRCAFAALHPGLAGGLAQWAMVCTRPVAPRWHRLAACRQSPRPDSGPRLRRPDDVQAIFVQTMAHRLHPIASAGRSSSAQAQAMLAATALP